DAAVTALSVDPALVHLTVKDTVAGTEGSEVFVGRFGFKHRRRHHNLKNRAGSDLRLGYAIEQRVIFIFVESAPFFGGDADCEIVGIGRRMAGESKNFSG